MKRIHRIFTNNRLAVLACGLAVLASGCGSEQGPSPAVAQAQADTSAAWAKEKSDHPKSSRATGKPTKTSATGTRGYINKPG
jgi:hypothetical protein